MTVDIKTVDIKVVRVSIPRWSSVGYGWGTNEETGENVVFLGDHRPMRALGEALSSGEPISVSIEAAQILGRDVALVDGGAA
jgi:hypothetical protein